MNECNHCWHSNGYTLTSNPPQTPEHCCHCNTSRVIVQTYQDNRTHGPYAQSGNQVYYGVGTSVYDPRTTPTIWEHVTAKALCSTKDNETTVAAGVPLSIPQADGGMYYDEDGWNPPS